MRLNAFLAACGVTSRRKAEAVILEGRVRVNGRIVLLPYFAVDPERDDVRCDGRRAVLSAHVYVAMNKPVGVVCAVADKYDPVVVDLLPERLRRERVYPAGRLDRESEGLLILTNDGSFAQSILHPSRGVTKEYEVLLNIEINERQMERWRNGFEIQGRHVRPIALSALSREPQGRWLRVVIGEGLKREVRTMANLAGFSVRTLIRRRVGHMVLENLRVGEFMELSFSELYTKIFEGGAV
ncbi:pseudouridine synthase [uncultured Fretibacterium sp.]|uniref:pseudouridine synthase n=1 Tax=uncultured Fretibacterium sp. TaxID=1678694 RepID=UPI0026380599|nr:pseudouridine synthase [uncultured Fretibacterium sp.]